ncbi:hypothetical protein GGF46_005506 [Coemansia sp. RSA 552]|nr:hypothetical protein GGF46_005506 [Coemansia sp. RSA 552]
MLAGSPGIYPGQEAHEDDGDRYLWMLRQARAFARSSDEQIKVDLAYELRRDFLVVRQQFRDRQSDLEQMLERARLQYDEGVRSQARDMARIQRINGTNVIARRMSKAGGSQGAAYESLKFSDMMVDSAQKSISMIRQELWDCTRAAEDAVFRRRKESELSLRACRTVLNRMPPQLLRRGPKAARAPQGPRPRLSMAPTALSARMMMPPSVSLLAPSVPLPAPSAPPLPMDEPYQPAPANGVSARTKQVTWGPSVIIPQSPDSDDEAIANS